MTWLAITLLVLGLLGATILRRHLHEAKLLRLREISHAERMAAMERNLPVPEGNATKIDTILGAQEATRRIQRTLMPLVRG